MSLIADKKIIKIEVHRGLPGKGVPKGGSTGQVLAKRSAADYDTIWSNGGGGGGAFWGTIEGDITEQTDLQTEFEAVEAQIAAKADAEHTHAIEDVTGLQTELDLKADESEIINLEAEIAEKADLSHGHAISDITALQSALNAKADTADLGTLAEVDDAPADGKQYARKNNTWNEVTGGSGGAAVWGEIEGDIEDQTDLQTALSGKSDTSHTHSGLFPAGGAAGQVLKKNTGTDYDVIWANETGGGGGSVSWGAILGTLSDQQDLNTSLSGKANTQHTHTIENVTDLQTALDEKADETEITDLETEIAGKAAAVHTHTISDVTNLQTALDAKADEADLGTLAAEDDAPADGKTYARKNSDWEEISAAAPAWGEITGDLEDQTDLQTALAGKAASTHSHAISDVTDLQSALDAKAPAYQYSTTDLTAGTSALTTGTLYFVYE